MVNKRGALRLIGSAATAGAVPAAAIAACTVDGKDGDLIAVYREWLTASAAYARRCEEWERLDTDEAERQAQLAFDERARLDTVIHKTEAHGASGAYIKLVLALDITGWGHDDFCADLLEASLKALNSFARLPLPESLASPSSS